MNGSVNSMRDATENPRSQVAGTRAANGEWSVTRRDFLKASGLALSQLAAAPLFAADEPDRKAILTFGLVADAHYADTDRRGTRHYRESTAKLAECVKLMNEKKADFLIELGDFKDEARPATQESTLAGLRAIEGVFKGFKGRRYHVLGNHDTDSISKGQFLANVVNTDIPRDSKHYSFDLNGLHLVVLDANYRADGADYDRGNFDWTDANVPKAQLDWLRQDLGGTSAPVIVFVHQQLDGQGSHCVKNAADVRKILQEHRKVLAVFQGHNHAGQYSRIEGIHYYTLKAMVEGQGEQKSSYAAAEVLDNHDIVVTGYRRAAGKTLVRT